MARSGVWQNINFIVKQNIKYDKGSEGLCLIENSLITYLLYQRLRRCVDIYNVDQLNHWQENV